jgi:hypothetical protein
VSAVNIQQFALAWLDKRDVNKVLEELFASPEWQAFERQVQLEGMM